MRVQIRKGFLMNIAVGVHLDLFIPPLLLTMRCPGTIHLFARTLLDTRRTIADGSTIFDAALCGSGEDDEPIMCSLRLDANDNNVTEGIYDVYAKVCSLI